MGFKISLFLYAYIIVKFLIRIIRVSFPLKHLFTAFPIIFIIQSNKIFPPDPFLSDCDYELGMMSKNAFMPSSR
jgi:hypothetical protein